MTLLHGPNMKHTHNTDILFPEDAPFYSAPPSYHHKYSSTTVTTSQPLKYSFPKERLLSSTSVTTTGSQYSGYENVRYPPPGRPRYPVKDQLPVRGGYDSVCHRLPSNPKNVGKLPSGYYNVRESEKSSQSQVKQLPPSGRPLPLLSRSDSRRRTWSPPAFTRAIGTVAMRSYHSNEQLDAPDDEEENIYEELDAVVGPPRLTPVSGRLPSQNASGHLIKPIAFKPIAAPPSSYVSSPQQMTSPAQLMSPGQVTSPRLMTSPGRPHSPSCGSNAAEDVGSQTFCASLRSIHSSPGSLNSSVNSAAGSHGAASPAHSHNYGAAPSPAHYGTVSHRCAPSTFHNSSHDDGYASQPDFHSHSNSNASTGSYSTGEVAPLAIKYVSDFQNHMNHRSALPPCPKGLSNSRTESHASLNTSQMSVNTLCSNPVQAHTPSPSDSGMGDIEILIREKDAELDRLRRTMERNEQAILQVCAEKTQNYAVESQEMNTQWEKRLRAQQQKSFRTEQGLLMQIFKLQQERKSLKSEVEQLSKDRETSDRSSQAAQDETLCLRKKIDETQWQVQQKSGEISLLKNQLRESQDLLSAKDSSLLQVKSQLADCKQSLDAQSEKITLFKAESEHHRHELERTKEALTLTRHQLSEARANSVPRTPPRQSPSLTSNTPDSIAKDAIIARLKSELETARTEVDTLNASFKSEKEQWMAEKNKVILYQKHLQLNYMQMQRKNKMLEADIEQLTLELENRDFQLNESPEAEESIC